jgi:hypothetical protein
MTVEIEAASKTDTAAHFMGNEYFIRNSPKMIKGISKRQMAGNTLQARIMFRQIKVGSRQRAVKSKSFKESRQGRMNLARQFIAGRARKECCGVP